MASGPVAVFLPDSLPKSGGGHVIRCLALAEALAARGWQCRLLARPGSCARIPRLAGWPGTVVELPDPEDARAVAEAAGASHWAVVDNYRLDARFERSCRDWAEHVAVLDDLADRDHDCELLLDQAQGRQASDYARRVPAGCTVLTGSGHALLLPEYGKLREAALTRRRAGGRTGRILVSFGAVDSVDMTSRALDALAEAGLTAAVDVVLGPAAPHLEKVRVLAAALQSVRLHEGTDRMAGLMAEADLALGAAGVTSWERCCLGLPALVVPVAGNQEPTARALGQCGAATVLEPVASVDAQALAGAMARLWHSPNELSGMAEAAAALCDGGGAGRMASRMEGLR